MNCISFSNWKEYGSIFQMANFLGKETNGWLDGRSKMKVTVER